MRMRTLSPRRPSLPVLNTHRYLSFSRFASEAVLDLHHHQPQHGPNNQPPATNMHSPHLNNHQSQLVSVFQQEKTMISLIKSCTNKIQLLQIHAHLLRTSLLQNPTVSLPFLSQSALYLLRDMSYSLKFFTRIENPNISHYDTMIRAYALSCSPEKGFQMYRAMLRFGVNPNPLTSSFAAKSCIKINSLVQGLQIHGRILKDGHQSDNLLLTTLMDLYSSCGKCNEACKVFDEMSQRDTVAWNVLLSCFTRNGRTRDALRVFDMMQKQGAANGFEPDDVTCLLVLQACASLNAVEFGEKVHRYIEQRGYGNAVNLCNSLIAMYSRCGCLNKAYEVFKSMENKGTVSWSAMISGFASNGHGRDAIDAFKEMQRQGVAPDNQTFTGLLSACSHSRLLREGRNIFYSMSEEFGIEPNVHHYGCMVDLLGRSGLLDDAYELILNMKVKPDATVWRTLLGACRIHGRVALGEFVIEHLIELKAQEAGDYVLLLNMYSSVGNWEKVAEVRKLVKEKGIQTTPSCSTIELKGEVHEFIAYDVFHPRKNEVYEMLDEIINQLRISGYVTEIKSELHNISAKEKQNTLSFHSEKLAIAFGVLSTPSGTTIRVANSLRMCVDCHNFAKMLSAVYDRKVVIRDHARFHHFMDGLCSCNDYW